MKTMMTMTTTMMIMIVMMRMMMIMMMVMMMMITMILMVMMMRRMIIMVMMMIMIMMAVVVMMMMMMMMKTMTIIIITAIFLPYKIVSKTAPTFLNRCQSLQFTITCVMVKGNFLVAQFLTSRSFDLLEYICQIALTKLKGNVSEAFVSVNTVKSILSVLVVKIWEVICWNHSNDGSNDPNHGANNVSSSLRQSTTVEREDDTDQTVSGDDSQH